MNLRMAIIKQLSEVILQGKALNFSKEIEHHSNSGFIKEVCFGTLRYYHQLCEVVDILITKPFREKDLNLKVLLLSALYQLEHTNKPAHAIISESVNCCPLMKKEWAKGVINASLRRYTRERDQLLSQLTREGITSHPAWLLKQFEQDWPEHIDSIIENNNQKAPLFIRVNIQKITLPKYEKQLQSHEIEYEIVGPHSLKIQTPVSAHELPGFKEGLVSIQDLAAQQVMSFMNLEREEGEVNGEKNKTKDNIEDRLFVLDACAAPGGKSAAILEQYPHVDLVCVEYAKDRFIKMNDGFKRLGIKPFKAVCKDASSLNTEDFGLFDRILIDAPCTGVGVIRRHPDIKLLKREEDIASLCEQQHHLLEALWPLVKPGGSLIYATCSILKAENEKQMLSFVQRHSDAKPKPCPSFGIDCKIGAQSLPGSLDRDGFYLAVLEKSI